MALLKKIIWMVPLFLPLLAGAQRLPFGVTPQHYSLAFTPDLEKAVFSGDETIDVEINRTTNTITLNAAELEFQEASITEEGKIQPVKWRFEPEKQQAT